jgi:phenylacetate-CoA ligase
MKAKVLRNSWHGLPRSTVRLLQAAKLRHYLRDVVLPFQPHYREMFQKLGLRWEALRTLDDLRRLPFTDKHDLSGSPERSRSFVIAPEAEKLARRPATILRALLTGRQRVRRRLEEEFRPIFMTSTTGRSADPVPFVFSAHDIANLKLAGRRMMEVAGSLKTDRMLNMFPFAPHLAFWQAHYAGTEFGVFMLSTGGGKTLGADGNLRLLRKLNPEVLIGMPTFVYHVLHEAVLDGVHCGNLRCIVLGGEKVASGLRRKLRDLAQEAGGKEVRVIATYGFTEAKMAWVECPFPVNETPSGYHMYPDIGIVEIVDPKTGESREDGEPGEIVFTALDARGSCVLRYRTGDLIDGGLTYAPCPYCGRAMPRLLGNISRASEVRPMRLEKLKGTLVDFNALEHALDETPGLGAWQIEIRKAHDDPFEVDQLVIHASVANGDDETRIAEEISRRMFERAELRPNRIEFHGAAKIRKLQGVGEELKERKLVDHRPAAASGTFSENAAIQGKSS